MRIEAYNQVQQAYGLNKTRKSQKNAVASFGRDALEISGLGKDVQFVKQAVRNAPDTRDELTASLKARIDAGTYQVSGDSFADKLLEKYSERFV
ncbi:MAG: flagellar biosynthesis anti-sigma factor FlgM [Lachnospiraceae bacterium]|nr:flagellar biosynthesis anti-sigma factor FlgM [Lachnospiraceae bacterium]